MDVFWLDIGHPPRRPRLADLLGDGLLESIFDMVVLPHRETAYDPMTEASVLVNCHVVKNYHVPITYPNNPIRPAFAPAFGRFSILP